MLILIGCIILSSSCGFTAFIGEPGWAQYPFQELARIPIEENSGSYLSWAIVDDAASGTVIFDMYDYASLTDQFYYWDGTSLLETTFPNAVYLYEMISMEGPGQFITVEYDTNYFLRLYKATETGNGTASITMEQEILFDIADFPGLTGGTITNIHYAGGRVYGQCPDSAAGAVTVLSYAVDDNGFSDPSIELSAMNFSEVDAAYFTEANALEQTFWHSTDVSIEGFRFYPDSEAALFACTKGLAPGNEEYNAVIQWDGTDHTGETAAEYTDSTSFYFLQDTSFIETGTAEYPISHRILNLSMEELGVITDIDNIEYIGDGIIDDEHVLFYLYDSLTDGSGDELLFLYIPVASVAGGV